MSELRLISLDEFNHRLAAHLLDDNRRIDSVHLHHTWRPRHRDWRGLPTLQAMRDYHMRRAGMRDIAQHLTIDPGGGLWLGRDFAWPPASAKGHNGTTRSGPFMIEVVGDFDQGQDMFGDVQRGAVVDAIAVLFDRCGWNRTTPGNVDERLHPHTRFATKSCPGSAIYLDADGWRALKGGLTLSEAVVAATGRIPTPSAVRSRRSETIPRAYPPHLDEASVPEYDGDLERALAIDADRHSLQGRGMQARKGVTDDDLVLRHHAINSRLGELSSSGHSTTTDDLRALFEVRLRDWITEQTGAGRTPRILLWAHGGLVSESDALAQVRAKHRYWLDNGIYPIYFVWETGLLETLGQMLERGRGPSDVWDAALERIARIGKPIWSAMRRSAWCNSQAQLASGGVGAAVLAQRHLAALAREGVAVEVHAVGHSAGSIFLLEMIAAGLLNGSGTPLHSLQFLAPALRLDRFRDELLPHLAQARFALYTMDDQRERDDTCMGVYRKSLLYLVRQALETRRKTPLSGLERDLANDAVVATAFGIGGDGPDAVHDHDPSGQRHLFWSRDPAGSSWTDARSHGGFDDDARTLDSVVRFIHGLGRDAVLDRPFEDMPRTTWGPSRPPVDATGGLRPPLVVADQRGGRRLAVCIGIDAYPVKPLAAAVADARAWADYLQDEQGFTLLETLFDRQATLAAIVRALDRLVREARAGDLVAFMYSGHGTQCEDVRGLGRDTDEADSFDEALVAVDSDQEGFLLDDLIAATLTPLAPGAKLLMIMDCCHSETNSRFAPRAEMQEGEITRYVPASSEGLAATRAWVRASGLPTGRSQAQADVLHFAACRDAEYAYESRGRGHFSLHALASLREQGSMITPTQLIVDVRRRMNDPRRQNPQFQAANWRADPVFGMPASRARGAGDSGLDGLALPFLAR